jgi:hypothetical protein
MECEYLQSCGFFKKYCISHNDVCQGLIYKYCKGDQLKNCKRLEYRKNYGTPPSDNMMPSGLEFKSA